GRVSLRALNAITTRSSNAFQAGDPSGRSLDFDRNFRNIDPHMRVGVPEHLLPTGPNVFPAGQPRPTWMDTDCAGIRSPDFIHQVDVLALQGEIKLQVGFNNLFRIGHTE